ncbi:hypothetical protein [Chitinivibrio alkaliphilus]|uniref:Uncharacterized protein n=1 Tax=Chitinivibrio alkaliphilus ACht1 TaxID=1313304 RepID=U7D8Q3_9BACT|nr:hypothetical protein [Chitinivibrio alkaliphilus]ERP39305.1 hypothetical protein CALK_0099 [Chitinivibrio alkaliphilus ACht1]
MEMAVDLLCAMGYLEKKRSLVYLNNDKSIPTESNALSMAPKVLFGDMEMLDALAQHRASLRCSCIPPPIIASLVFLQWLGRVNLSFSKGRIYIYPLQTEQQRSHATPMAGHILPDFSLVIPPDIQAESLLFFCKIGQLHHFDVVFHGTIRRDTIEYALRKGISPEIIEEFLRSWNATENIMHTVQDWVSTFHRSFMHGDFLGVTDSAAERLLGEKSIAPHLREIRGYRFFIFLQINAKWFANDLNIMDMIHRAPLQAMI